MLKNLPFMAPLIGAISTDVRQLRTTKSKGRLAFVVAALLLALSLLGCGLYLGLGALLSTRVAALASALAEHRHIHWYTLVVGAMVTVYVGRGMLIDED